MAQGSAKDGGTEARSRGDQGGSLLGTKGMPAPPAARAAEKSQNVQTSKRQNGVERNEGTKARRHEGDANPPTPLGKGGANDQGGSSPRQRDFPGPDQSAIDNRPSTITLPLGTPAVAQVQIPIGPKIFGKPSSLCSEENEHSLHVAVRLTPAESRVMYRIMAALQENVARLNNNRIIASPPDVVRWILQQMT